MASIRTRLTSSYAAVLGGTLVLFAAVLFNASRTSESRALQLQVSAVAEIGSRILQQSGTSGLSVVVTDDSLVGRQIEPGVRRLLAALPDYLIVADSTRLLYQSELVSALSARDQERLTRAIFTRLTPEEPAIKVTIGSRQLLLVAHFETPTKNVPIRRVVAGASTESLTFRKGELFVPVLVTIPILLALSVLLIAAASAQALAPVDQLIHDLEAITDGRSLHRRLPVDEARTELDRLAETINAMIARLEASFAALRRFTADASHELKTPLTVLRADIERAMQAPSPTTEQLEALEEALQETARMADLVDSLLTLARADEGRFDILRDPVPLEPMMREVFETALILGEEAGLTVTLAELTPMTVRGDGVRLRQLLLNLVTNAIKYTARGGSVELGLELRGDQVAFWVKDTGLGIAGADLPFIFDRFWRADRARSRSVERGGFGLGLAIAQWIAHAHGGSISVASRLGRGTTFTFTMPVASKG